MSQIDIRKGEAVNITSVKFADSDVATSRAHTLYSNPRGGFTITGPLGREVSIADGTHLRNLRKALDKAEELGWV